MTFGRRLRQALEHRDWSQGTLSAATGVSQGHISMIIAGERAPGLEIAVKLAEALGVSLDWLCELPERTPGTLSPDEDELLGLYRALPSDQDRAWALGAIRLQARSLGDRPRFS